MVIVEIRTQFSNLFLLSMDGIFNNSIYESIQHQQMGLPGNLRLDSSPPSISSLAAAYYRRQGCRNGNTVYIKDR